VPLALYHDFLDLDPGHGKSHCRFDWTPEKPEEKDAYVVTAVRVWLTEHSNGIAMGRGALTKAFRDFFKWSWLIPVGRSCKRQRLAL
jgi:hypothetical protein